MARRRVEGRYTVSGPFEVDHPVPNIGAGMSCAQTFAAKHSHVEGKVTYYVRDLHGAAYARVTKEVDGRILTTLIAA